MKRWPQNEPNFTRARYTSPAHGSCDYYCYNKFEPRNLSIALSPLKVSPLLDELSHEWNNLTFMFLAMCSVSAKMSSLLEAFGQSSRGVIGGILVTELTWIPWSWRTGDLMRSPSIGRPWSACYSIAKVLRMSRPSRVNCHKAIADVV